MAGGCSRKSTTCGIGAVNSTPSAASDQPGVGASKEFFFSGPQFPFCRAVDCTM